MLPSTISIPKLISYSTFLATATLLMVGILSPYSHNILPVARIFDAIIIFIAAFMIYKVRISNIELLAIIFISSYFIYYTLSSTLLGNAHILDVFQSSKFLVYVIIFIMLSKVPLMRGGEIKYLLLISLFAFFVKYAYSITLEFTDSMSRRPGVLTENNFELIYLAGLFFFVKDSLKIREHILCLLILIAIMLMGGSRSAIASFMIASAVIYVKGNPVRTIAFIIPGMALLSAAYFIFESRGGFDLNTIDRFRFFNLFMNEMDNRNALNWIAGDSYLTPMMPYTCQMLSFYEKLFSFNYDSTCYSVILHSFLFRVIIDHGLFVYLMTIFFSYYAIKKNTGDMYLALGIVALVTISGLSVSSFNSSIAAFMVLLAITSEKKSQSTEKYDTIDLTIE